MTVALALAWPRRALSRALVEAVLTVMSASRGIHEQQVQALQD